MLGGTSSQNFHWNYQDLYSLAEYRPFRCLDVNCSVLEVISQSNWNGAHSIPLIEKQDYSRVVGMASQSSLIRWLVELDPARLGPAVNLPLKELKIGSVGNPGSVLSVQTDNPLFKVIEVIVDANVTCCAVLDSEGHLVGNISISDLAQLREEENQHYLNHPVQTYLSLFELAQPVTCVLEDSLLQIMKKIYQHRIHRIYCITPQRTLYSVITLSDILNALTVIATKFGETQMS
jgi:CBS domain-containing protein